MMDGWIKLHRKLTQTSFYKDSQLVHLAIHLLLKAGHSDVKIIFNNKEITLKRGSLITGRHTLSRETGIHESTIYRKLKILEKVGFSHTKSNNKFSIITISNYNAYNYKGNQDEQHIEQSVNNQRTQTRMYKKNKNIYMCDFKTFWEIYPSRNGKKLEKDETLKRFQKLKEDEILLILKAVKHYANSEDIKKGIGIRDPKRFLGNGKGDQFWREWIEPETKSRRFDEIGH